MLAYRLDSHGLVYAVFVRDVMVVTVLQDASRCVTHLEYG